MLFAQGTTGSFLGSVQDVSGALVPGATVKATNLGTKRVHPATTNADGNYSLPLLPIGTYELSAEASGFKRAAQTGLVLHVAESLNINFTLEVGRLTETVEVTGAVTRVNTEEGSMSALFGTHEVANIPTNGRYFNQLVALMPGTVSNIPAGPSSLAFNRAGVSVNGTRFNDNNWSVDGVFNVDTGANQNMNDAAGIETVAEFRILRSNYDAEYGVSGGAQINIITKGGTREFHGHLQEFFRNNIFDARNFFSRVVPAPLRFNNPGFTVGGPLYIPKVYNKDRQKTFFFASLEWQKIRRGNPTSATVPTEAMKQGVFPRAIRDPLTGQPFPGNVIPANRIDPNAAALAKIFPSPTNSSAANNFVIDRWQQIDYFSQLARLDHHFSSNHQLMFRGSRNHYQFNNPDGAFEPFRTARDSVLYTWGATLTSTLSPSLTNEFQIGRTSGDLPAGPPVELPASQFGVNIPQLFPDDPSNYPLDVFRISRIPSSPPRINITGYASLPFGTPANSPTNIWQIREGVSLVRGSHLIKAGGLFHREYKAQGIDGNYIGAFDFNGQVTGDGFADFLLGTAQQYREVDRVAVALVTRKTFEAFVSDRWKVTRNLSLSMGARFSYFGLPKEENGEFRVFIPALWSASKAPQVTSSGAIVPGTGDPLNGLVDPSSYLNNERKHLAPRFSLSWDPFGKGKTVIRAGYGITVTRESFDVEGIRALNGNPPYVRSVTLFRPLLSNPAAGTTNNPIPNLRAVDLNVRAPYYQQWSFGFEHAITAGTVLNVAYVGNKGTNLTRTVDINEPVPNLAVASNQISANSVRPYLGYGTIVSAEAGANSNYNSLQASINRSFQQGLSMQISYTFSKAITDARIAMTTRSNFGLDRGVADFDVPHNFSSVVIYELPFWKARREWYGRVLGGWQISAITRFMSGQPTQAVLGRDIAGVGGGTQRPQVVRNPILPKGERTIERAFDTRAFVEPQRATFATTGAGALRQFGINNWDLSLMKNFVITERVRLEFQGDAFNAFNHTQFSGFGNGFHNLNFGVVTSARPAREMQLGLKLRW